MLNLEELRRLEAEATPGPWLPEWELSKEGFCQVSAFSEDGNRVLQNSIKSFKPVEDAALIVAMRNALPELLSQHEQLIERVLRYATDYVPRKDLEEAQAENAALRRVNKALGNMLEPHGGVDVG